MDDHIDDPWERDATDSGLAARFDQLETVTPPDLWDRISAEHAGERKQSGRPPALRGWRRPLLVAAAVIAVVAGVNGAASLIGSERGAGEAVASGADAPVTQPTTEPTVEPTAQAGTAANPTSEPSESSVPNGQCRLIEVLEYLRIGSNPVTGEQSDSPDQLASQTYVLRGDLILGNESVGIGGHRIVRAKVSDSVWIDPSEVGREIQLRLPFPANNLEAIDVGPVPFVAFAAPLSVEPVWAVDHEGLWIGCRDDVLAASVFSQPEGPGWDAVTDGGTSLDELWHAAIGAPDPAGVPLGEPLRPGDGTAIFDVTLTTNDRLRVSVPSNILEGLDTVIELPDQTGVTLAGRFGQLRINFGECEVEPDLEALMTENRQGSTAALIGMFFVSLCRSDDLLTSSFEPSTLPGTAVPPDIEAFDVRLMRPGAAHNAAMQRHRPGMLDCTGCSPSGPHEYPDAGVIVNRTGATRLTAVSTRDLAEVWTRDLGGIGVSMRGGADALYVEVVGDGFHRLDPATGESVWRIDQDVDERNTSLSGHSDDVHLLQSTIGVAGDSRPPLLRSIDRESGAVRWQAEGRSGSQWHGSRPAILDGVVVMMDVSRSADQADSPPPGATLRAFDVATGDQRWVTELDSTAEANSQDLMFVSEFDFGPALLVRTSEGDLLRVEPSSGAILWRQWIGTADLTGTDYDATGRLAIDLLRNGQRIHINPETGEVVSGGAAAAEPVVLDLPDNCRTLYGEDPWLTLFSEDLWAECVLVAATQNIEVWNKGFDLLTVAWPGGDQELRSDFSFATGPIGNSLGLGRHRIEASPYPMPDIIVIAPEQSPSWRLPISANAVGPVTVGMTLEEATSVLGHQIVVDPNLASECWIAVVVNDPLSPFFVVSADDGPSSTIIAIEHPLVVPEPC